MAAFQKLQLRHCLDTLGRDLNVQALCHGNGSSNDSLVTIVFLDIGNQRLIDNKAVDEAIVDRLERNIARAEVIQRQPNA